MLNLVGTNVLFVGIGKICETERTREASVESVAMNATRTTTLDLTTFFGHEKCFLPPCPETPNLQGI